MRAPAGRLKPSKSSTIRRGGTGGQSVNSAMRARRGQHPAQIGASAVVSPPGIGRLVSLEASPSGAQSSAQSTSTSAPQEKASSAPRLLSSNGAQSCAQGPRGATLCPRGLPPHVVAGRRRLRPGGRLRRPNNPHRRGRRAPRRAGPGRRRGRCNIPGLRAQANAHGCGEHRRGGRSRQRPRAHHQRPAGLAGARPGPGGPGAHAERERQAAQRARAPASAGLGGEDGERTSHAVGCALRQV